LGKAYTYLRMNWLLFPLFALAQASCYDYEYYDPDTGKSIPGNACAGQAAAGATAGASVGQPQTFQAAPQASFASTTTASPQFGVPATQFGAAPAFSTTTQFTSAPAQFAAAPQFGAAPQFASSTPQFASSTPQFASSTPQFASSTQFGTPVYGAPAAVAVSSPVSFAAPVQVRAAAVAAPAAQKSSSSALSPELEYYKQLGIKQARQHKQNKKIVDEATQDLQRSSLVNTLTAGTSTNTWYPVVRLEAQKDAAGAYKSEANIANKNADDAYKRYQKDPSRINLLVSKYQDLNADLRDAAYHYNVVNSGTFGQQIVQTNLFGLPTASVGLFSQLTQLLTQKQQTQDLQKIQKQMARVATQIQSEAKTVAGAKSAPAPQNTVQQRLMATTVYGPSRGR